ncbi:hypothetical protein KGQ27_02465 [Patescibacteria group bacterium]|nr:hypothetical protein [Patescibacteria group bacterium]MDE1946430.1 hypothetical protein [Patescibacteria group bacterium]MDE2011039.1 hypothetical protein [Patescibacteria group bacterium]MDE2233629.1 hypothetical protein [Patescibacteria group bacterium]
MKNDIIAVFKHHVPSQDRPFGFFSSLHPIGSVFRGAFELREGKDSICVGFLSRNMPMLRPSHELSLYAASDNVHSLADAIIECDRDGFGVEPCGDDASWPLWKWQLFVACHAIVQICIPSISMLVTTCPQEEIYGFSFTREHAEGIRNVTMRDTGELIKNFGQFL